MIFLKNIFYTFIKKLNTNPIKNKPKLKESLSELSLPPWVKEIQSVVNLHELKNTTDLSNWLSKDKKRVGDPSKIAWCGDAAETAIKLSLSTEPFTGVMKNPYWARNWLHFGISVNKPYYGMIGIWERGKGGHVGFIVGYDQIKNAYLVIGGNQSDSISYTLIDAKTRAQGGRLLGLRWPSTYPLPKESNLPNIDGRYKNISTNEA
jgi:uncharacterized protein (TIGR02594 family)